MDLIYLDSNATTQPAPEVIEAVDRAQRELWANPSSVHRFGQQARQKMELARDATARLIGARGRDIIFTSGGTESNNLALRGTLDRPGTQPAEGPAPPRVLITTAIEHSAIREPAEDLAARGVAVVLLPLQADGMVDPATLREAIIEHGDAAGARVLVSIQWANNETGVLQPMDAIHEAVNDARSVLRDRHAQAASRDLRPSVAWHVDATQAVGKIPVDVKAAGVDMLTLAGHKFHGPKGVGALYVRTGVRLARQLAGGPQERQRRGGTENVPGVVGLGVAADLAAQWLADESNRSRIAKLRDDFERMAVEADAEAMVLGAGRPRLWNTSNIGFGRLEAEAILLGLSERGVCASAGAACSSGSLEPSPVLLAMGVPEPVAHGAVRFSLCRWSTDKQIEAGAAILREVVGRLRQTMNAASPGG